MSDLGNYDKEMDHKKAVTATKLTDDLVVEILSRLPYKSFCRSKCVCQAWSAFSSDPHYCKKLPKKFTSGLLYQSRNHPAISLVSLSQNDGEIDEIFADLPQHEHLELLDCCNGLVLCKYRSIYTSPGICRLVVCNPATREWRILPDTHTGTDDPRYETILAFDPSFSPQFYVFNFHLEHDRGLILGTSKLEIFSSHGSTCIVDDKWDSDMVVSWRSHLFLHGMLHVETTGQKVVVFEGLETMSDGIPPYHWTIELPSDTLYVGNFTHGCFGKSSGILHYALPHENGRSIVVWTFDDYAPYTWTVKCHLSMKDAFGRDDFIHYDNGGDGGDSNWFWNCSYRILALDLEREVLFLFDETTNKLLSYNISIGERNEIRDGFQWYRLYVPCYSELPAQEPSV